MFKILLKKITRNRLDYGWAVCIQKIVSHIFKPIFKTQSYHIYMVDLQKFSPEKPKAPSEFVFRFINSEETELLAQIENIEEWLHGKLLAKLQNGQKCLVAMAGETVAGFNLIGFNIFTLPPVKMSKPIRSHECFSEQISVNPKFRNKGLGTELRRRIFAAMKEAGYHRMYGGTQVCNTANKALSKKVGLREFAVARYTNIFGFDWLSISRKKD
jgi:RimJ/RimL family protein N-acetyltransferase